MISRDEVRNIAASLPGTHKQATSGGRPSWRTAARIVTWIYDDPEAMVVWLPSEESRGRSRIRVGPRPVTAAATTPPEGAAGQLSGSRFVDGRHGATDGAAVEKMQVANFRVDVWTGLVAATYERATRAWGGAVRARGAAQLAVQPMMEGG